MQLHIATTIQAGATMKTTPILPYCGVSRESFTPGSRSQKMTRYLISFDDGTMIFPEEDLPEVAEASHAVVREAQEAGVWVFGGGVQRQRSSVVATDGTVTEGPFPETKAVIGGFSIIDARSREEALAWAAKIAVACRCAQEVREIMPDPDV